ncbi:hypothetical protein ABZS66_51230 [Dactylosporangium sp. NPDC005572]|uniref:hypothetical protein n=1 Tax=Dactylosporangium sp. NPDC005572 TaxID=3156889 RepID=UPI0033AB1E0B
MFRAGSALLGLDPADCLLVGDDPVVVAAAAALGFAALTLSRAAGQTLNDVVNIVAGR